MVERLINERTKFQQHEIDEIKRRMEMGMDIETAAASLKPATPAPEHPPGTMPFNRVPSRLERMESVSDGLGFSRNNSRMEPETQVSLTEMRSHSRMGRSISVNDLPNAHASQGVHS